MSLPHTVVVGAPRAGTTSLHGALGAHPLVWVDPQKENQFFALPYLRGATGPGDTLTLSRFPQTIEQYEARFRQASPDQHRVEFSPAYLVHPQSAHALHRHAGEVRIVILLRHPVERAYSQFAHLARRHVETLPFEAALAEEARRIEIGWGDMWQYQRGMHYSAAVRLYQRVFRDVLVVFSEELFGDGAKTLRRVTDFMGVAPHPLSLPHLNQSGLPRFRWAAELGHPQAAWNQWIHRWSPSWFWRLRYRWEAWNEGPRPPLSEGIRQRLWAQTEEDRRELAALLGRPLPWHP